MVVVFFTMFEEASIIYYDYKNFFVYLLSEKVHLVVNM